jgi:hypothetical protein
VNYIYPTHRCFDDAIEYCEEQARADAPGWRDLILVHAIILVPEENPPGSDAVPGERAVHAWVEDGDLVWDAGVLEDGRRVRFSVERAEYYAHYRVQETTRYTMLEALIENQRSRSYGPWRSEYQALCRPRSSA